MTEGLAVDVSAPNERVGRYRWVICGLLFAATALNYVDRQMIGVLKPTLQHELGWTETSYANIVFWFQAAYAVGYLSFGKIVDKMGARAGYAIAFVIWTLAHTLHGAARTTMQFAAARSLLGFGESGNFPASLKAVAEWFPARERALATGILNAGSNVGAIITPLLVPAITLSMGWRAAFVITGAFSLVWLAAWLWIYRQPREKPQVGAAELALIESDPADPVEPVSWREVLSLRETWAYALGKFVIDPIWWMFLFWLPDFLARRHHLDLQSFGPPLVAIYLMSDIGSIVGGWSSSTMMKRGISVNAARKLTMLGCAFAVTPILLAQSIDSLWGAVAIIGLATAAHQAFSANLYTLPSDLFPRRAVGTVVGIGGTVGAVGGMLMAEYAGYILQTVGTYKPIFAVAGMAYFVALAIIHLLSPRLAPARIGPRR
jgi:ACS family hexuronate transporter-like MFS transporter